MAIIRNKQSGFTLIETFVAISILVMAVLGPMTLLSNALQNSRYIKDEVIATFLAQEGVELMIDNRNNGGGSFFGAGVPNPYTCTLLLEKNGEGYHCGGLGESTSFKRVVTSELIYTNSTRSPEIKQYKISSLVTFPRGGASSKTIEAYSIIFK